MGAVEAEVRALGGTFLVIYTDHGWDQPIADAVADIEPYFAGSYWTGTAPPIGANVFPTNGVVNMDDGVLLAGTGDILSVDDVLAQVEAAAGR